MLKMEKEYQEKYGNIPKDMLGRLNYLLSTFKTNRAFKGKLFESLDSCFQRKYKEINYTIYLLPKATPRPRSTAAGFF